MGFPRYWGNYAGNIAKHYSPDTLTHFMYLLLLDGYYGYAKEWQRMLNRSDREVKELLEAYGNKCKHEEVSKTSNISMFLELIFKRNTKLTCLLNKLVFPFR